MTTFTWTIANLEYTNDDSKGVVVAHWCCDGNDGENSIGAYGTQGFIPDASAEGYIAFEALTESDVLAWIWDQAENWKTDVEAAIQSKLDEMANPPVVSGLPWINESL